ncbi:hypothetical protein ElyMa_006785100 [Elysia marginata]|uniref:Uncharacterized protein n=1 Tax=Elysia marginata TaxID=1093978 RepID=A0AAV4J012_9GAST|nr:hypothetical protein ElyMa_006785100 [Elysia marginata]
MQDKQFQVLPYLSLASGLREGGTLDFSAGRADNCWPISVWQALQASRETSKPELATRIAVTAVAVRIV